MACSIRISFARRTIFDAIIQQRRPADSNKNNNVRNVSKSPRAASSGRVISSACPNT
jgi:hypothetical protein